MVAGKSTSQIIREYLGRTGLGVSPSRLASEIQRREGIQVTPSHVAKEKCILRNPRKQYDVLSVEKGQRLKRLLERWPEGPDDLRATIEAYQKIV